MTIQGVGLIVLVLIPTAIVVVAMCFVMWAARTTPATTRAILAGIALAVWAVNCQPSGHQ